MCTALQWQFYVDVFVIEHSMRLITVQFFPPFLLCCLLHVIFTVNLLCFAVKNYLFYIFFFFLFLSL